MRSPDWWAQILAQDAPFPPIARLLARHPDAEVMTQSLIDDLSVERLVRIAQAEHGRCRLEEIPDHLCEETRAQMAWDLLHSGMRHPPEPSEGGAWAQTAELLSGSPDAGDRLEQLRHAPIHRLITACEQLVDGPYRHVVDERSRESGD